MAAFKMEYLHRLHDSKARLVSPVLEVTSVPTTYYPRPRTAQILKVFYNPVCDQKSFTLAAFQVQKMNLSKRFEFRRDRFAHTALRAETVRK